MSRIGYAEVASFYASVERLEDPGLRARPTLVGGNPQKGGKVQSASLEALECGVAIGMTCERALELCPDAVLRPTHMKRYREISSLLHTALRKVTDGIEIDGLAGAYFDVSHEVSIAGGEDRGREIASELRAMVRNELGLQLRVGIAPVKFMARLAAQEPNEEGFRFVADTDVASFLSGLSPERLPGVGAKTQSALARLRIDTVGKLLEMDPREVEAQLGTHGRRILAYARGEDESRVRTAAHRKTLSHEVTFDVPVLDRSAVEQQLAQLCKTAESGLRQQHLCAARVAIKLRFGTEKPATRSRKLMRPIESASEIHAAAMRLLDRTEVGLRPLALLGIALAGLEPPTEVEAAAQLDLFN